MVYALDTNTIVHYLRGNTNVHAHFDTAVLDEHRIIIPHAVDYELCRGFLVSPAPKKEAMYNMLTDPNGHCVIVDMGEDFWNIAKQIYSDLRRKSFTVGEIDILIAAFCLYNDCTLVTNNTRDFTNISGLKQVDWT